MEFGGTSARCGLNQGTRGSQASRIITTIMSRYSPTTTAQRRARRALTRMPTKRVSQSGHLRSLATEMPQYGHWLSILPPSHDLVGCESQGIQSPNRSG
jgi:hypothetical protein